MHVCINITYIHIYVLSQQWLCGNSWIWVHDVQLYIAGIKLRKKRYITDNK